MDGKSGKPKFDKKKWREMKYDHKSQVKQKNEAKKVILKSKLNRQLRRDQKEKGHATASQPLSQEGNACNPKNSSERQPRFSRVQRAKLQFKKTQEERQKLEALGLTKKKAIAKALEIRKKRKQAMFKVLSNQTKTGQPVMNGRMQLLFETIKKSFGVDN